MGTRPAIVTLVLAVLLAVLPATASADTTIRRDPRNDAPAGIDITRVRYSYTDNRVSTRVRVPELADSGRIGLSISRYSIFEAGYVAVVRRRSDGTTSRRLLYYNHFDTTPRRCDVDGSWNSSTGIVRVSVPRSCLENHRTPRIYVAARVLRGQRFDDAPPARRLPRG